MSEQAKNRFVGAFVIDSTNTDDVLDALDEIVDVDDTTTEYAAISMSGYRSIIFVIADVVPLAPRLCRPLPIGLALTDFDHFKNQAQWVEPANSKECVAMINKVAKEFLHPEIEEEISAEEEEIAKAVGSDVFIFDDVENIRFTNEHQLEVKVKLAENAAKARAEEDQITGLVRRKKSSDKSAAGGVPDELQDEKTREVKSEKSPTKGESKTKKKSTKRVAKGSHGGSVEPELKVETISRSQSIARSHENDVKVKDFAESIAVSTEKQKKETKETLESYKTPAVK